MAKGNWRQLQAAVGAALAFGLVAACGGGKDGVPLLGPTATSATRVEETPSPPATVTPGTPEPAPELAEAAAALREGRYAEAAAMYEAVALAADEDALEAQAWLGAGVAAFEDGDRVVALDWLGRASEAAPAGSALQQQAAYLLARRLNEAAEFEAARAALRAVERAPGDEMQAYLDFELGRALAGLGDRAGAALAWDDALASPSASEPLQVAVFRERAAEALAAGDGAGAAGWLQRLVGLRASPKDRYQLAGLAAQAGDWAAFEAQLLAIIREEPASDYAVLAIDDLRAAGYAVDVGSEGYVYYRRRGFAQARQVLSEGVLEPGISPGTLAYRTYYLAASYEDAGFLAEAVPLYDEVPGIDPGSPYAHRARYWAARATEGLGDSPGASERYRRLVLEGPGGEFTAESAFRAGYVLLAAGDAAGALATWGELQAAADERLYYWSGRAFELLEDPTSARGAYEQASSANPLSIYGQEAARALSGVPAADVSFRALGPLPPVDWEEVARWVGGPGVAAPAATATAAGELAAIGLRHEAADLVLAEADGLQGIELVAVLREAHEAGLADVAARLATTLLARGPGKPWEAPRSLLQLAYPLEYVARLSQVAAGAEVDPLLLAALVRQESFWDPAAVSVAGAMGLAQVMPATGEGIAAAIGPDSWGPADLLRPSIGLAFGAYYLGVQLERFGTAYAALAAYNAGPGNALGWVGGPGGGGVADFVERVDIAETKHYVEQVLEHYAYYARVYREGG